MHAFRTIADASEIGAGDVRVMANHMLDRVPEMRAWTIPVNPFAASAAGNLAEVWMGLPGTGWRSMR